MNNFTKAVTFKVNKSHNNNEGDTTPMSQRTSSSPNHCNKMDVDIETMINITNSNNVADPNNMDVDIEPMVNITNANNVADSQKSSPNHTTKTSAAVSKISTPNNKRKRGRPRKTPNSQTNHNSINTNSNNSSQRNNGRGRPKITNNKDTDKSPNKKRGRGRPKKYVTVEDLVCSHCNKKFETRQELNNCLRNHCNITCEWPGCGKLFNRKTSYNDHMLRHRKIKNQYCRGCGYGPLYRSTRTSHERKCAVWTNMSEAEKNLRRGKPGRPRKSKKPKNRKSNNENI